MLALPGLMIGATLFLWGSISWARGKGYTWRLGMVGLLGVIGLTILALMPDGHKRSDGAKVQPEGQPASADSSACPEAEGPEAPRRGPHKEEAARFQSGFRLDCVW